jgi:hypothetical protein
VEGSFRFHQWRASQEHIPPDKVVFIDETWAKTNMTRTYGRSPLGTRLIEQVPTGRWQTTTFLGAMRAEGFVAPPPQPGLRTQYRIERNHDLPLHDRPHVTPVNCWD